MSQRCDFLEYPLVPRRISRRLVRMKRFSVHRLEADILVAGGGMSGVCCALAAARQGARVILCQDRPVLGGNASSEIRMHIVGANTNRPCADLVNEPRESGLIEEIRLENAIRNPQRSASVFDEILREKCLAEKSLTLLLNTTVLDAEVEGKTIRHVRAARPATEDTFDIDAAIFVDCTGDGGLGAAAGAAYTHGREASAQYGEKLAPAEADAKTLGSTLLFAARKYDCPMPFTPPPWARKITAEDMVLRDWAHPGQEFTYEYGFWWLEWGGHLNTIKDNEAIRDELLSLLFGIWDYVKKGNFGAENWALDWFGVIPGKRESRRFHGRHMLTEADVLGSRPQHDAIAYGGWPIDLHPVYGFDQRDQPPCVWSPVPLLYDIPLRSCVAADLENLMFAGRNISATHVAFGSTRVMATCAAMGEGVGIAAAYAIRTGCAPSTLPDDPAAMKAIQETILREDGFLIGRKLRDENNLLHAARLSASSEQPEGPVRNILSGFNRALSPEGGVAADRREPGTHRWISAGEEPAWILAEWTEPVEVKRVEAVFDTGLHRLLTLTHSDHYASKMIWGPQPEMVRDFVIEYQDASGWHTLAEVQNNARRRWRYEAETPVSCRALRLTVRRSWGLAEARVVRLAAYASR
jgi:hypothetical protein